MSYTLHRPETIAEAASLEISLGESAHFIAGGTDLVIQMARRQKQPEHLIDLMRIPRLDGVTLRGNNVAIGALATHKAIWQDRRLSGPLEAIREAAQVIGGHQVRNMATIGGNVANASPAADMVTTLVALDASVVLDGPSGPRSVAVGEFLVGPRRTARRPGEIISELNFAAPAPRSATAFLKAGRRKAMEIALVNVAVWLEADEAGTCRGARIALGSVGPTTLRATGAEAALQGQPLGAMAFRHAGQEAVAACRPISDVRASAGYRSLLVAALVERALTIAADRIAAAGEGGSRATHAAHA